jgi:hypothetical protein
MVGGSRLAGVLWALGLGLAAGPAAEAQEGPEMQLQRCIWACLAGPGGGNPDSPAYGACVEARCAAAAGSETADHAPPQRADPTRTWQTGPAPGGARFAGIDAPGQAGRMGLYYFRHPDGRSDVALVVLAGLQPPVVFTVGAAAWQVNLQAGPGGWPTVLVPRDSPLFDALRHGGVLSVAAGGGQPVFDLPLDGAAVALDSAMSWC